MYGSLAREHEDIWEWLTVKDWHSQLVAGTGLTVWDLKNLDFNYPAPLDMTNISTNYGDEWLAIPDRDKDPVFLKNVEQALRTAEPGFSFNFGPQARHTGRNACTEFISDDDSDVCNLGSVNFSRIGSLLELEDVTRVAAKFLICGSIRGELPHDAIRKVRDRNRRIGMGIMGLAEWQLKLGEEYGPSAEMENWLAVWARATEEGANEHCDRFFLNRPKAYRAVAPAGTIALLAGTTSGIEPPYAVAFKRRYLVDGKTWKYQFVVDSLAKELIASGVPLEQLERNTALALADQTERRLGLQALVQKYTDMGISSTINLPAWGSEHNNEDTVPRFAKLISDYAPQLRGVTFYPDGARGGQPITAVPYAEAVGKEGVVYEENADAGCASGVCGI
jgi:ribonucleoside-diphosphate reductase alpha chain